MEMIISTFREMLLGQSGNTRRAFLAKRRTPAASRSTTRPTGHQWCAFARSAGPTNQASSRVKSNGEGTWTEDALERERNGRQRWRPERERGNMKDDVSNRGA